MRTLGLLLALVAILLTVLLLSEPVAGWAISQQRSIQQSLATALTAVRRGDQAATTSLIAACMLYGVVHAIGPGHGKILIGGVALASRKTALRMAALGLSASVVQGLTAIALVYGGLGLFGLASRSLIQFSETWLTAASYGAVALVGLWLFWRGGRLALSHVAVDNKRTADAPKNESRGHPAHGPIESAGSHGLRSHNEAHGGACMAGCKHLPTAEEVSRVETLRDSIALVLSIGLRPCSGALIVLALAWRYGLYAVGAASALGMAIGTGVVVATIALTAAKLRESGVVREPGRAGLLSLAAVQITVGVLIMTLSVYLAAATLNQEVRTRPFVETPGAPAPQISILDERQQPAPFAAA